MSRLRASGRGGHADRQPGVVRRRFHDLLGGERLSVGLRSVRADTVHVEELVLRDIAPGLVARERREQRSDGHVVRTSPVEAGGL